MIENDIDEMKWVELIERFKKLNQITQEMLNLSISTKKYKIYSNRTQTELRKLYKDLVDEISK
jgi:hypothetical protein